MTRNYLKSILKKGAVQSRLLCLANHFTTPAVVILRYHSILNATEAQANCIGPSIIHSQHLFDKQMAAIARNYNVVTLDDICSCVANGDMPQKGVAITFDDGFKDNYTYAFPILEKYGIKASFYITTGSIESEYPPWFCRLQHAFRTTEKTVWVDSKNGEVKSLLDSESWRSSFLKASRRCALLTGEKQSGEIRQIEKDLGVSPLTSQADIMMNWEEVRELYRHGHIIGSHTQTHPNVALLGDLELSSELEGSKKVLEEQLQAPVAHFSYPSPIGTPHYTHETIRTAKSLGYQTSVTCTAGRVLKGDNALALKRIAVPFDITEFLWKLELCFLGIDNR